MRRLPAVALATSSLVLLPLAARADWPMNRHDPGRTAATTAGTGAVAQPAVAWSYYLGGSVSAQQMVAADVDGDHSVDVVLISGGRLVAKRSDDTVIWESPPLDLSRIDAVADLDHDGALDVVATGRPGRVAVFAGTDGHLEWTTRASTFGPMIGAVRLGRLDDDAFDDLYVADAACGGTNSHGDVAVAYSFAHGFGSGTDDGAQRIWPANPADHSMDGQLERGREYNCGENDVLADLDGDGRDEVVVLATHYAYVFDGRTGAKIASGGADAGAADPHGGYALGFSLPYGQATTRVADVDGDGHDDIVGLSNNGYDPSINSRAVFVLGWDAARPRASRLYVRWVRSVADVANDVHAFIQDPVADLDGDGRPEVVTTLRESGAATTYAFDAATGAVRATLAGATIRGIYQLAPGQHPTVLVAQGAGLAGYRFDAPLGRADAGAPAPVFTLPNASVASYFDRAAWARASGSTAQLDLAVPGAAQHAIVLSRNNELELWDTSGASPAMRAAYPLPMDVSLVATAPESDVAQPGAGILLARSDGFLVVLDAQLHSINFGTGTEIMLPGIRTGGFYSGASGLGPAPVAARFPGATAEQLVVGNSRNQLVRLDASHATTSAPPSTVFTWSGAAFPLLVDTDGDHATDLVVAASGATVEGRQADGATSVFRVPVASATQSISADVVPLAAPGTRHYTTVVTDRGNGQSVALDVQATTAADARVFWSAPPVVTAGSWLGFPTADDVDGDGYDDVIVALQAPLHVYSGAATGGAQLATGLADDTSTAIVVRGRAGAVTHIGSGAAGAPAAATIARSPVTVTQAWALPAGHAATRQLGAVLACPTDHALVFAQPLYESTHLALVDAATGAVRADLVLAVGHAYSDDAALAASGARTGLLGNASATSQLAPGRPAFLVGSTDGFLYAVDPCATVSDTTALVWSLDLGAPVGDAILADTDGDGHDEVVVGAADGFLYGVDQAFDAPAWVHDTIPGSASTDDVDTTPATSIAAAWAPVAGATGYEWAVYTVEGTAISRNPTAPADPFTPVDAATTSADFGTGLVDGHRYYFAVRAIGPGGIASPAVRSNGTTFVHQLPSLDAGGGGTDASVDEGGYRDALPRDAFAGGDDPSPTPGCQCRATGAVGHAGAAARWIALAAAAVACARRRRGLRVPRDVDPV